MMIQSSDNTCTNMLLNRLGGMERLNSMFEAYGLGQTRVNNWLPDLKGTNVISMRDMATVLFNLSESSMLTEPSRREAFEILLGTHNRRLIPALLPPKTPVAHKTGDIGTALGNAGIVFLPNGQKYILAIQVERPFNDYAAKEMIQNISKLIYDDLTGNSPTVI